MEAGSIPADGGTQGEAPAEATPDLSAAIQPVLDRVSELGSSVNDRFSTIESRLPAQEAETETGDDLAAFPDLPPEDDPQQAAQWLDQLVNDRATKVAQPLVEQALQPLMQELDGIRMDREAQQFVAKYPEFTDPEKAEPFMDHVTGVIEELGLPEEVGGKLITSSRFLGIIADAARHQEAGRNEVPADQAREQPLEPAGGANLGGGGESNPALDIVRAGSRNSFWTG